MSYELVDRASKLKGLKPAAKRIVMNYADHHNKKHAAPIAWVSKETQMKECEMSQSTWYRHHGWLTERGAIKEVPSHPEARTDGHAGAVTLLDWHVLEGFSQSENSQIEKTLFSQPEKPVSQFEKNSSQIEKTYKDEPVIEPVIEPVLFSLTSTPPTPIDPAFEKFASAFFEKYGTRYQPKTADFVQLAKLRRIDGVDSRASPRDWNQAVENYFASPVSGQYSLAKLVALIATYRISTTDAYGKAVVFLNEGKSEQRPGKQEQNVLDAQRLRARMCAQDSGGSECDHPGSDTGYIPGSASRTRR